MKPGNDQLLQNHFNHNNKTISQIILFPCTVMQYSDIKLVTFSVSRRGNSTRPKREHCPARYFLHDEYCTCRAAQTLSLPN